MKKWKKILISIALTSCLIGSLLTISSYMTGGSQDLTLTSQKKSKSVYHTEKLETFNQIEFSSLTHDGLTVNLKYSNNQKASITYAIQKKDMLSYKVNDGKLKLTTSQLKPSFFDNINFVSVADLVSLFKTGSFETQNKNTITISLPKGQVLNQVSGDLLGYLSLSDVSINNIDLSIIAGSLNASHIKISNGNLKMSAGDIYIENSHLSNLKCNLSAGDIDLENVSSTNSSFKLDMVDFTANSMSFFKENDITTSMGDTDITLKDYNLTVKASSHAGDQDVTSKLVSSQENKLSITSNMGDISLEIE